MAITYSMTVSGDRLLVTASGFDENVADVERYGMAVIEACTRHGVASVLCDEMALEYRIGTFDTYRAAEYIAGNAPRVGLVAIACNPRFIDDARFWETVVVNRGMQVRVFPSLDDAVHWLDAHSPSSR